MSDSSYRTGRFILRVWQSARANVSRVLPPALPHKMALPRIWSQWFAGVTWHDFEHTGYLCEMSWTYRKWRSRFLKGARHGVDELSTHSESGNHLVKKSECARKPNEVHGYDHRPRQMKRLVQGARARTEVWTTPACRQGQEIDGSHSKASGGWKTHRAGRFFVRCVPMFTFAKVGKSSLSPCRFWNLYCEFLCAHVDRSLPFANGLEMCVQTSRQHSPQPTECGREVCTHISKPFANCRDRSTCAHSSSTICNENV